MKLEKKYDSIIQQHAREKLNEAGVVFSPEKLEKFRTLLKNINTKKNYKENDQVHHWDVENIARSAQELLTDAVENLREELDHVRAATSPAQFISAAENYLVAVTAEEWNYADIPHSLFSSSSTSDAIGKIVDMKPDPLDSSATYFKNQRGKNANELSDKVNSLVTAVNKNRDNYVAFSELYAEYQALTKRQENHGAIWRFFHKKENEMRTTLLSTMENALSQCLPDEEIDLSKEPSELYRAGERKDAKDRFDIAWHEKQHNPSRAFGYANYKNDPALFEAYEKEQREKAGLKEIENKEMQTEERESNREPISDQVKADIDGVTEEKSSRIPDSLEKKSVTKEMI